MLLKRDCIIFVFFFFCSSRRRHTSCALVTGVQTWALPISLATTNQLISQAQGLTFNVAQSQATFNRLYPGSYAADTPNAQMVQDAQTRWQTSEIGRASCRERVCQSV